MSALKAMLYRRPAAISNSTDPLLESDPLDDGSMPIMLCLDMLNGLFAYIERIW